MNIKDGLSKFADLMFFVMHQTRRRAKENQDFGRYKIKKKLRTLVPVQDESDMNSQKGDRKC